MAKIEPIRHTGTVSKTDNGYTAWCVCGWTSKQKTRTAAVEAVDEHEIESDS